MKTKEQILKWLDKQPWKGEFYEEVSLGRLGKISNYNEDFVMNAFCWFGTKSGGGVWAKRHADFLKWYDNADKPMSWEEYCDQNPISIGEFYIDDDGSIQYVMTPPLVEYRNANVMSKDLCEAFIAYMKLIQLRNAWVKDCDKTGRCFRILTEKDSIVRKTCIFCTRGLSFPTTAMADEFVETFNDLLEVAKPLI